MDKSIVLETNIEGLKLMKRGKVRDIYDLGDSLLIISTDRISAFDVVLPNGIPYKGIVLTKISEYWFNVMKEIIPNHIIPGGLEKLLKSRPDLETLLRGRSMVVKKAEPLAVECVVRGYLSGSGWNEYKEKMEICGNKLPAGLKESSKLPEPILTPATKADVGEHDINIDFEQMEKIIGMEKAEEVKLKSILIYKKAGEIAEKKGMIIADTKFEFGTDGKGQVILIDEVLTPDSSRFWPKDGYREGISQKSFDKQFVRDYLLSLGWDKKPPGPELPEDIVKKTSEKYLDALFRLTGIEIKYNG